MASLSAATTFASSGNLENDSEEVKGGARDDSVAMQYLLPGWQFDPKRPCLVR